ncbi:MAG: hypothetical protein LQ351_004205 [Letrouitia transgressa]|nr:MAG: hypothetical protein LQ351_004205 [Letrouitia transgressa]
MNRRPFLFFGLPFLATVLAGSFLLTPFTAMRYEANDRKSRAMSQEEFKGFERKQRPFDIQEEYWRLQSRDVDQWEQKRVKRFKDEPDGTL